MNYPVLSEYFKKLDPNLRKLIRFIDIIQGMHVSGFARSGKIN